MSGGDWRDARERRDEVKRAFAEGHAAGAAGDDPKQAWGSSDALKRLGSPLLSILPHKPPFRVQECDVIDAEGYLLGEFPSGQMAREIASLLNRKARR